MVTKKKKKKSVTNKNVTKIDVIIKGLYRRISVLIYKRVLNRLVCRCAQKNVIANEGVPHSVP
jgi:hypothetical protein